MANAYALTCLQIPTQYITAYLVCVFFCLYACVKGQNIAKPPILLLHELVMKSWIIYACTSE